ncbi:hypothetical protein [Pyxidicoccus caerfyrddinensis]|jgi:hypothetical protein|uniref:hypothetical protein n=1 Tax=Pyxidicoccus caerfyrddinensis TaxID=2709663 RepID=UPI0013DA4E87|nr:hypothetical protein [Pyxidicoccus caerfyrddinensis]
MLIIRTQQLQAFAATAERDFLRRLARAVRRHFPAATQALPEEELLAEVEVRVEQARGHGLTWESSIADFVGFTFDVGPGFDSHPSVRLVLEDPALPPDRRMERLTRELPPHVWSSVRVFTGTP